MKITGKTQQDSSKLQGLHYKVKFMKASNHPNTSRTSRKYGREYWGKNISYSLRLVHGIRKPDQEIFHFQSQQERHFTVNHGGSMALAATLRPQIKQISSTVHSKEIPYILGSIFGLSRFLPQYDLLLAITTASTGLLGAFSVLDKKSCQYDLNKEQGYCVGVAPQGQEGFLQWEAE
ncbi:hypothetical protein Celaphus_00003809, partial [Cervus elaphus hippelaphus]